MTLNHTIHINGVVLYCEQSSDAIDKITFRCETNWETWLRLAILLFPGARIKLLNSEYLVGIDEVTVQRRLSGHQYVKARGTFYEAIQTDDERTTKAVPETILSTAQGA